MAMELIHHLHDDLVQLLEEHQSAKGNVIMPEVFLNEAHHVAMLAYDFGRKWQQDQKLPKSEFRLLVQALEGVPVVNSKDSRFAPVLRKLREVKRLTEQLAHPAWDTDLGPELCSAGLALLEVIKSIPPEKTEWLNWMEQSGDSPAPGQSLSTDASVSSTGDAPAPVPLIQSYPDKEPMQQKRLMTDKDWKFVAGRPVPLEENRHYEFKETKGGNPVNSIKNTCDEYVVAFLNREGGRILWGVRDGDRCVIGVTLHPNHRNDLSEGGHR